MSIPCKAEVLETWKTENMYCCISLLLIMFVSFFGAGYQVACEAFSGRADSRGGGRAERQLVREREALHALDCRRSTGDLRQGTRPPPLIAVSAVHHCRYERPSVITVCSRRHRHPSLPILPSLPSTVVSINRLQLPPLPFPARPSVIAAIAAHVIAAMGVHKCR